MYEPWTYRDGIVSDTGLSLIGFDVEAVDGKIGSVEEESNIAGDSFLVVDTGFWTFGKKVLLPAAAVTRIDAGEKRVLLALTQEEIEHAPESGEDTHRSADHRRRIGEYYGSLHVRS
ncbi:hypothetical protein Misp01_23380 [Microtetraspora sp. NBRC 13810]|uniref:PRC-barrel domain-containing protein n=1 Tax=Microtetraspora sp. NBRC 13810 TaxID=3030990 RepID=UPI0024A43D0B|nr:PRC-barrel domain-containing protein [Microtetraspora sp. NBRC 13810]GLW07208.1 hypothetical protein Misp01_23380 [Microtetraspora sp. NBRC 13810]